MILETAAVVLDHDDTGIVTRSDIYAQMKELGTLLPGSDGQPMDITNDQLDASWGMGFEDQLVFLYGDRTSVEDMTELYEGLMPKYPRRPTRGYLDFIAAVEKHSMVRAIVSSHNATLIRKELVEIGDDPDKLAFIHGSEETAPFHKPDKRTFDPAKEILAGMGIAPELTTHIGDDLKDHTAATAARWNSISVLTGIHSATQFRQAGAVHIVDGLYQISVTDGALLVPRRIVNQPLQPWQ